MAKTTSLSLKTLDYKSKAYLNIIAVLLLVALAGYFLIIPKYKEIKTISAEITNKKNSLEEENNKGRNILSLDKQLKASGEKIDSLQNIFLKKGEEINFITEMENLIAANQIQGKTYIEESSPASNYYIMPVKFSLTGKFSDLMAFIRTLEKKNYYLNFNYLDIRSDSPGKDQAGANNPTLTANLTASVYWK